MPIYPTVSDIVWRLAAATLAGVVVGFNREARGQAAGLRTTTLVSLAACLSMVLANLLLPTSGKSPGSFVQMDVMRLPLGVLSGMGFLGAGAIIRRGDAVMGVTTAATLWFMTVVGLAIGAGQLALGAAATVAALVVLWLLGRADARMPRKFRAALNVSATTAGLPEDELRRLLAASGQQVVAWAVTYCERGAAYEARAELEWAGRAADRARAPDIVCDIAAREGVRQADWSPQAISG